MKKTVVLALSLILLGACSNSAKQDQLKFETYTTMYTDLLNATGFKTSSDYFTLSPSLTDVGGSVYRYDVIIDDPKVAMYDVEILLIQDDGSLVISDTMMPSLGIFEDKTYYMIPFQVNTEANVVQGIDLNGLSSTLPIRLKMVVQWKDANNAVFKEYFQFELNVPAQ